MINWICPECRCKCSTHDSVTPGQCKCGEFFTEDASPIEKTFAVAWTKGSPAITMDMIKAETGELAIAKALGIAGDIESYCKEHGINYCAMYVK